MGYVTTLKENQGVHFEGNGMSIDVIVRYVDNRGDKKRVDL